mgnify:CR=1 FL=1
MRPVTEQQSEHNNGGVLYDKDRYYFRFPRSRQDNTDQKTVKDLLHAIDNPTEIQLRKINPSQEEQKKQDVLCAIKKQLASMN